MLPTTPWSTFAPAASRFCEDAVAGWVREPANTWSNIGFLVAGLAALLGSDRRAPRLARRFGLVCIFLGVGSAAFHASRTYLGGVLDSAGMQAAAAFMLAANARRLFPGEGGAAGEPRDARTFWSLAVCGIAFVVAFESFERTFYALEMTVAGVMEIVIVARSRGRVGRAYRWLAGSWATFIPAYALWWTDLHGVACNPNAHVMNGHAAWHLLMAASLYCVQGFHAELFDATTVGLAAGIDVARSEGMATRSQQFRAETERSASAAKDAPKAAAPPAEEAGHAAKKATYAHEEGVALDHRSRKSSRKSANHAKTDATVVHAVQMKESSPEQTYERNAARSSRSR